ncbi:MAG TPA: biotin/lipoyl-binding protein [Solirubrobacteraceae bacterium]|nr:biotin/lipoyl-binding protein [Solirubrobacteraceae bacterium]
MKLREDEPAPGTLDVEGDGRDGRGPRRRQPRLEQGPNGRRTLASRFREQPVLNSLLVLACIALIILGYEAVGPASSSSSETTRTSTAKYGVVQSTVSGTGNIESADQLNLGFKTSGTVTHIYVKQGQHVAQGQLLATLDPSSAEVSLEQAKASLQSAEANLAKLEETEGETSGGSGSAGTGATASTASTSAVSYTTEAIADAATSTTGPTGETEAPTSTTPTSTTPTTTTTTTTPTTTTTKPSGSNKSSSGSGGNSTSGASQTTGTSSGSTPASDTGSSSTTKQSAATREANLASAKADVKSDKLSVQSAEQAVDNTKLYAPQSGTIVTLSGEVGETVSGTGTTRTASSSSSSSTGSSSTGASTAGKGSTGTGASATGASSSDTGSSGSSSFAVLNNLGSLQIVVPLSESEIGNVHEGQIATVTIEALNRKVAAHVASVSDSPTSSSGAVSYDVTFQLDQDAEGLKVGMSATAEVVIHQAEGVNVPTSAIKADTVTVVRGGKHVTQRVTTGLAGNSSTIVLSGLKAGEEVVLPSVSTSGSSSTSLTSKLGSSSRGGGGGLGGGIGGGGFGGGFAGGGPP